MIKQLYHTLRRQSEHETDTASGSLVLVSGKNTGNCTCTFNRALLEWVTPQMTHSKTARQRPAETLRSASRLLISFGSGRSPSPDRKNKKKLNFARVTGKRSVALRAPSFVSENQRWSGFSETKQTFFLVGRREGVE
jgi:hypothetical protein